MNWYLNPFFVCVCVCLELFAHENGFGPINQGYLPHTLFLSMFYFWVLCLLLTISLWKNRATKVNQNPTSKTRATHAATSLATLSLCVFDVSFTNTKWVFLIFRFLYFYFLFYVFLLNWYGIMNINKEVKLKCLKLSPREK